MADNLDQQKTVDNSDQQQETQETQKSTQQQQSQEQSFSWKSRLSADMQKAPSLQKFDDTPEGLGKAVESHLNLEKLLGHEKVPVPKDANDREGWDRYKKAFKIPEKPEGYALEDAKIPDSMKGMTFDKGKFAEVVHKFNLTPEQAKGLWNEYGQLSMGAYNKAIEAHSAKMTEIVNGLRAEWGDAYDANVDLGQTVINKFAGNKEEADLLTNAFLKDPLAIKFLAKIGNNFAENKIGEFSMKRFAKSPDEAQAEIDSIRRDPNHPFNNEKVSAAEHQRAVDYLLNLYAVVNRSKGQA